MDRWFVRPQHRGDSHARPIGRPMLAMGGIFGDLEALDSVLRWVRGPGQAPELCAIAVCGDLFFGGPDPFGVWQRLQEVGATLVRGDTDLALCALSADALPTPTTDEDKARLAAFVRTRDQLGEIVCRRLGELPSTAVVSLDGRAGVMATCGSPADPWRSLTPRMTETELIHEVGCTAEDVLIVGRQPEAFLRFAGDVLVAGVGSIARSPVTTASGGRTAHAVLLQELSNGSVRARGVDVEMGGQAASPSPMPDPTPPKGTVRRRVG